MITIKKLVFFLPFLVSLSACSDFLSDDSSSKVQGNQVTITVDASSANVTRVAYADVSRDLTWESGDKLQVVGMSGSTYVAQSEFIYTGTPGLVKGTFTGTDVPGASSYRVYSPGTVVVNSTDGSASLGMDTQTQNGDNNTAHMNQAMLLEGAVPSSSLANAQVFFTMQSSIMKFVLTNVPAEVGTLKEIRWTSTSSSGLRTQNLKFADGSVVFSAAKNDVTAYMGFMPNEMSIVAGGKFRLEVIGSGATCFMERTLTNGKTYAAGNRYTASVSTWTKMDQMQYTMNIPSNKLVYTPKFATAPISNLILDWGDGTSTNIPAGTATNDPLFIHTYSAASSYKVTIKTEQSDATKEQMPKLTFVGETRLVSMDTPMLNFGSVDASSLFTRCSGLKVVVEDLFSKNKQIESFYDTFTNTGLTSIPENLFANNPFVKSFYRTFGNCYKLTGSIPANLFANNPSVTAFDYAFWNCLNLSGSIPANLFVNNLAAMTFGNTFSGCSSLSGSIPENLFANNPSVTTFNSVFNNCSSLSGSIPEKLFANNPSVTNFSYAFNNCGSLSGSIPENLFANNTLVTTFDFTFTLCSNLSGSIPANLFASNTSVTSFNGTFLRCSGLSGSIPTGLFANNLSATDFRSTFSKCSNLVFNKLMFERNGDVNRFVDKNMNFTKTFEDVNNKGITAGEAPDLWNYNKGTGTWITTGCFLNANASNAASIPAGW